jgi:hypothetical protein
MPAAARILALLLPAASTALTVPPSLLPRADEVIE